MFGKEQYCNNFLNQGGCPSSAKCRVGLCMCPQGKILVPNVKLHNVILSFCLAISLINFGPQPQIARCNFVFLPRNKLNQGESAKLDIGLLISNSYETKSNSMLI